MTSAAITSSRVGVGFHHITNYRTRNITTAIRDISLAYNHYFSHFVVNPKKAARTGRGLREHVD